MGAFNKYGDYAMIPFIIPVGAAAPTQFSFRLPFAFRVISLAQACDACNATDKVAASLLVGATTIITGVANTAPDTIGEITGADAGQSLDVPANTVCKIALLYGGTAASVNGVCIMLTIQPSR